MATIKEEDSQKNIKEEVLIDENKKSKISPYSIPQTVKDVTKKRSFSANEKESTITPRIHLKSSNSNGSQSSNNSNSESNKMKFLSGENSQSNTSFTIPSIKAQHSSKVVPNVTRRIASATTSSRGVSNPILSQSYSNLSFRRNNRENNQLHKSFSGSSQVNSARSSESLSNNQIPKRRNTDAFQQIMVQFDEIINPLPPTGELEPSPSSFRRFKDSNSFNNNNISNHELEQIEYEDSISRNIDSTNPNEESEDYTWHRVSEQFEAEMRVNDSFLEELSNLSNISPSKFEGRLKENSKIISNSKLVSNTTNPTNFSKFKDSKSKLNDPNLDIPYEIESYDFNYQAPPTSKRNDGFHRMKHDTELSPPSKTIGNKASRDNSKNFNGTPQESRLKSGTINSFHERVAHHVEKEFSDIISDIQKQQEEKTMLTLLEFKQQVQEKNTELVQRTKQVMQNMKRMLDSLKKQKDDLISGFVKQKRDFIEEIRHLDIQLKYKDKNIKQLEIEKQKIIKNANVDPLKRKIDSLQKEIAQVMLENAQLKSVIEKNVGEKMRFEQDLSFKNQECEKLTQDLKQQELENDRLQDRLKAAEQKIAIIQNHNESLQRQIVGFQETISKSESQLSNQHTVVQSHLEEIELLTSRSNSLQEKVNDLKKLESLYQTSQDEIVKLKVELTTHKSEVKSLKEKLSTSEEVSREKLKTLWQKHKTLKITREELKTEFDQLKTENDQLKFTVETLKAENDKLLKESTEFSSHLQSENKATSELLGETKLKLKKIEETSHIQVAELMTTKEALQKEKQAKLDLENKIKTLSDMLSEKQIQVGKLLEEQEKQIVFKERYDAMEKQNIALQNQMKLNNDQMSVYLSQEEQQKEYVQNLELKMKMAQMSKDNVSEQLKSTQSQLESSIKEKDLALEMVSTLEKKNNQLQQAIQRLKEGNYGVELEEFNHLQHDHRNAIKGLEELRMENAKLKKSITQYRGVIQSLRYQYNSK